MRHCLRALSRHSEADFRSRSSPSPAKDWSEMQVSTAPPLCPTGVSFPLAHSTLLSTPLRRGQAGARGTECYRAQRLVREGVVFSCLELGEAAWTCPAPPTATLGRSRVLPPLLLALSFRWRKISTNRLFTKIS